MLEPAVLRMARYLARRGALESDVAESVDSAEQGGQVAASAVSGQKCTSTLLPYGEVGHSGRRLRAVT